MDDFIYAQEKMHYAKFVKDHTCYIKSFIGTRITNIDSKLQLPNNSVLHVLDNLNYNENLDVPRIMQNQFIINETFKNYIHHNTHVADENSPYYRNIRYMYPIATAKKEFEKFRKSYLKLIRPAGNLSGVLGKQNVLTVFNHNPLWRIRTQGRMNEYNKFELIMRSILHSISSIQENKYQYVQIPLSETLYSRTDFMKAINKDAIDPATLVSITDESYMFLLHFLGFLHTKASFSLFELFPKEALPHTNIIFTIKDKAIIYNLAYIKGMASESPNMFNKIIKHITLLKSSIMADIDQSELDSLSEDEFDKKIIEINKEKNKKAEIIEEIDNTVGIPIKEEDKVTIDTNEKTSTSVKKEPVKTGSKNTKPLSFDKLVETETNNKIEERDDITIKQKERLKKISQKYKEIKLGDQTLEEILSEDVDQTITTESLDFLKNEIPDESMLKSSIVDADRLYMEKLYKKDLVNVAVSLHPQGMYLTDITEEDQIDELNKIKKIKLKYYDSDKGTYTTQVVKTPIIDPDGNFTTNGIKSRMKKQQVNLPICKISNIRVSLASNYNKTLVERNIAKAYSFFGFIDKYINKINKESELVVRRHASQTYEDKLPYEYTVLGNHYGSLEFNDIKLIFDFDARIEKLNLKDIKLDDLESKFGVSFGIIKNTPNTRIFIGLDNQLRFVDIKSKEVVRESSITELLHEVNNQPVPMVAEWTDLKILDKKLPIMFILAYRFGLSNILDYLKIDYRLEDKGTRIQKSPTDIVLTFNDKYLIFNRYPLTKSLILAGLIKYTKNYNFDDFNTKNVYSELLMDKNISTHYLTGIDNFFDLFLDNITRDVLLQMNEPDNVRDLLIRATDMLSTEEFIDPASMANHRLRSYERLNGILYNELSRQFAQYRSNRSTRGKFSINPEAVFQRILQDQSVIAIADINPVHDIKEKTGFTYTGVGGRTAQSFVLADRKFPKDGVGIISESTPDSSKVAITANTSMDPKLVNIRGMFDTGSRELDPTQILSVTALLLPNATNDDPKRTMFASNQITHHVPCEHSEASRMRTGYEKVVAHRASDMYATTSKEDGQIISVDDKLKLAKVKYKSGKIDLIKYGDHQGSVDGLYMNQHLELNVKQGDKIKKGDVLAYNTGFFELDESGKQVNWKTGVHANIAILECDATLEDSSAITKRLGAKLSMKPTELRSIKLTNKTVIHDMVKVGSDVDIADPLCVIEDEDISELSLINKEDQESYDMLTRLNKKLPKAKYAGVISEIRVYHACPIEEMTPSLAKIVKSLVADKKQRERYTKDTNKEHDYPKPGLIPVGTKLKGTEFDKDTVLVMFFITEDIACGVGDKIVFANSLKSVVGTVIDEPIQTESGLQVDGLFGGISILNRVVNSPFRHGLVNRCLEDVETNFIKIYKGEK